MSAKTFGECRLSFKAIANYLCAKAPQFLCLLGIFIRFYSQTFIHAKLAIKFHLNDSTLHLLISTHFRRIFGTVLN